MIPAEDPGMEEAYLRRCGESQRFTSQNSHFGLSVSHKFNSVGLGTRAFESLTVTISRTAVRVKRDGSERGSGDLIVRATATIQSTRMYDLLLSASSLVQRVELGSAV